MKKQNDQSFFQKIIKSILLFLLTCRYRIQFSGTEHIPAEGGVLLIGNHLSYLDWALIIATTPRMPYFAISREIYHQLHLKWFSKLFPYLIPISRESSHEAITRLQNKLVAGEIVVIFPEGRVSLNGQIGEFFKGFEKIVKNTHATIIPFYLLGVWGSWGSNATHVSRRLHTIQGRFIHLAFGTPLSNHTPLPQIKQAVFKLSMIAWQHFPPCHHTVADMWLLTAKKMPNKLAIADATGSKLSSARLIAVVRFLKQQFMTTLSDEEKVGLILPLSVGGVSANLALLAGGKTIINLNYTLGIPTLLQAIEKSKIKSIITSTQFIARLQHKGFDLAPMLRNVKVIYLEEVKARLGRIKFLCNLLYCRLTPIRWLANDLIDQSISAENVAAILFSSGSEGSPKGVELTHHNLVTNALQIIYVMRIEKKDILLSTLPPFHAFGLTVNMLVPLLAGVTFVCQTDPTDAILVGKLAHQYQATILTGTATFLNIYSRQRRLHPAMLSSLRLIIAGAEKVNDAVRQRFTLKFGHFISEGYGTTETSPVASVSLLDQIDHTGHVQTGTKKDSVGLPLPGTAFRIVDPNTLIDLPNGQAGLILIGGPQLKRGYLNDAERSANVIIVENNVRWYKTGDKGYLDEDGFLYIVDRYSRFAKLGGEMISLTAVEQSILNLFIHDDIEIEVMAIAIPDDRKGESIIIFYQAKLPVTELQKFILQSHIPNLMRPSELIQVDMLPKLGNGKLDYMKGKQMALAGLSSH